VRNDGIPENLIREVRGADGLLLSYDWVDKTGVWRTNMVLGSKLRDGRAVEILNDANEIRQKYFSLSSQEMADISKQELATISKVESNPCLGT
jgi:hypothetical protein